MNIVLKMEVIPTKYATFFWFMLLLAIITESKSTTLNVVEGDEAFLNFTYSCKSTEVTLQRANGPPFYNSTSPIPLSSSNRRLINGTDGKVCFLYLTINPVTRDDQGGYILTAYKDDPTQFEDTRISLLVAYLPGKVSCGLSEEYIDPDWVRLQCTALLGDIEGFIMCYQNGIKIPPLNSPQEHDETLSQTFLAKVGNLVYCCSRILDQTKGRCECKDSVWDPIQNKQVTNVPDPCPPTVPNTFSKYPTEDNEFEVTSPSTEAPSVISYQPNSNKATHGLIVVVCFLILVYIVSVAGIVYYFKRHPKKPPDLKTQSHVEESFIVDGGVGESVSLD